MQQKAITITKICQSCSLMFLGALLPTLRVFVKNRSCFGECNFGILKSPGNSSRVEDNCCMNIHSRMHTKHARITFLCLCSMTPYLLPSIPLSRALPTPWFLIGRIPELSPVSCILHTSAESCSPLGSCRYFFSPAYMW